MRQVYLDNSATTPIKGDVLKEMLPFLTENYGNASSLYTPGLIARRALDEAREKVATLINAKPNEVYFTGCGSESDNWVLKGVASALKNKGNHIITTVTEHPAMLRTCEYLEKNGYEVTYLGIDDQGRLKPEELEAAIKETTILVSIMMVNNEIGTIHPIKELAAIAKKHGVLFHTDAVQALGNVPIDVKDLGVDFLSMSAHKIYGPKGVGGLYIRRGAKLGTLIFGGGQESGKRAGTENVAGIVGFGKAAELAMNGLDEHIKHSTEIRNYLADKLTSEISDIIINGSMENRHPGNLNVTFKYIEGESILIQLDACGICISTGSACSSKSLKPSHVLSALGVPDELIHGTIRFSVGDFTTKEDIDYTVECTKKVVAWLRDLSPLSPKKGE
ncbi:cysteine desulfurase NifS [Eubacterium infirmum F0142]|nr:cysteine desulfurase NifS [Eubacterium infirmum F0142]